MTQLSKRMRKEEYENEFSNKTKAEQLRIKKKKSNMKMKKIIKKNLTRINNQNIQESLIIKKIRIKKRKKNQKMTQ